MGEGGESTMVNLFAINESTVRASAADMEDTDGVSIGLNHDLFAIETLSPYYQHPAHSNSGPHHNTILFKARPLHECDYSYLGVLANGGPNDPVTLRTWTADGTLEGEKSQWELLAIRTMKLEWGDEGYIGLQASLC